MAVVFTAALLNLCLPPAITAAPSGETLSGQGASLPQGQTLRQEPGAAVPELPRKTTSLVITLSLNKEARGDYFIERDTTDNLYMKVEDLVALKLQIAQDKIVLINREKYAPLSALRDVTFTFDEKNLSVSILGRTTETKKTSIELYQLNTRPQNLYYPRETSAFINYGINYARTDPTGTNAYSVSNRLGARTGDLFFISDSLYKDTGTDRDFVRLQSNITYERRQDLQWLVMGDQFANSGTLGSTVNMGGIGFSKLYRLDPYFITQPVLDVRGVSRLPSEADIYIDGVLVSKKTIGPGPFDLANIYSYAGAHKLDIVLKDAFGFEQRLSYPLYFSTQLLRQGLHEYSYNVGMLRDQYGTASNRYSKPVFSAFHRYGVTSALNVGAQAEGTNGAFNGGVSTAFAFPYVGVFSLATNASNSDGLWGSAVSFGHSYQQGSFNTNLLVQGFSRDYATVTSPTATQYAANFTVGFQLGKQGSISLGYSASELYDGNGSRGISAGYSRQLSRIVSLFATTSLTRTNDTNNYGVYVGFNFTFGNDLHGTASYNKSGDTHTELIQFQKDTPVGEGLGYHVYTNRTENPSSTSYGFNPGFQYNAKYGIYSADVVVQDTIHGDTTQAYNLSAAGALVYAGGFFAASRPVSDSFGIVMVDKIPNATVLNNGQEIGKTNASGALVIPNLTSYGQNQITLDVKNMPLNYNISGVNRMVSPSAWSGSCVSFDATKIQAVTGRLHARQGDKTVPLEFTELTLKVGDREVSFPTGKGGEFYLEDILPSGPTGSADSNLSCSAIAERKKAGVNYIKPGVYTAWGEFGGKKCGASITFPVTDDVITDIGDVQCVAP